MQRKKLAVAMAAAVALASGAYAIGSQAGDGSAVAQGGRTARSSQAAHGRDGSGLQSLASKLGVSASQLQAALDDVRKQQQSSEQDRKSQLATALAQALGVSADQVTAALDKLRVQHDAQDGDQAGERREGAHAKGGGEPDGQDADRPARGKAGGRHAGADGAFATALAKALGVDSAKVKAALQKLQAQERSQWQARRDAFAQALAQRLGIPASRVKAAFTSFPDHRKDGR